MEIEKRIRRGWALMTIVLGIEIVGVGWIAWNAVLSVVRDMQNPLLEEYRSTVVAQGIGIVLVLILALIWVIVTLLGAFTQKPWARASNLTIQVLAVAAATGILQGIMGTQLLGIGLLVLGILGLVATLMSRPPSKEAASTVS